MPQTYALPKNFHTLNQDQQDALVNDIATLAATRLGAERVDAMGKVNITVVDSDEQDDMLAQTLLSQERDLYAHRVNLERYETILANGVAGESRAIMASLMLQTLDRIDDVTRIIEALTPQLPSQARLDAAIARIK
ncbi:hypothetical protein LCGC14_2229610, partial [marine sediment metagenome]